VICSQGVVEAVLLLEHEHAAMMGGEETWKEALEGGIILIVEEW